jgi:hypothetical protein
VSWIKLRDDIHSDPAVDFIASRCSVTAFHVVGALAAAWSWAGRLSDDGKVPLATPALLDKITQTPGLARAMEDAGWLEVGDSYLVFPKWDRHNEAGAKARALASERQRRKRVTVERDEPVTVERDQRRGEEKREEIQPTPTPPASGGGGRRTKVQWAGEIPDPLRADPEFEPAWRALLNHRAKGGKGGVIGQTQGEALLVELAGWGASAAVEAIRHTIASNYAGIVPAPKPARARKAPVETDRGQSAFRAASGCWACGHENDPGADTCLGCRRPLRMEMPA